VCQCIYFGASYTVTAQEGPGIVIVHPGEDVELLCDLSNVTIWLVTECSTTGSQYSLNALLNGILTGHSSNGRNIIVENVIMNDSRNNGSHGIVHMHWCI